MKRLLSISIVLFVALVAASRAAAQSNVERDIGGAIRARMDAYARADAAGWARHVADECLCWTETKAQIQQGIASRPPNVKIRYGDVADLEVHVYGDTAVVRYRVTEYAELGGQKVSGEQRRVETYVRRDGGWLLVAGAEGVIPAEPAVAKIDPKLYDAYVGRYEYVPGAVDTVTREGDRLMVQPTGEPKQEVFPENETTFFAKGQDWRLVFVKDEQGRVTSMIFRQGGKDFVAKRIK